ncbi:hypothetical protein SDRG_10172 [Saprolegnia diclina VS20]|uniref:NUDE domain-containing protein n=1 Tax=Saprolegnia diclina (strain VS20) TaxID=1156394 RepID=T0RJ86_SAPDV|nr:hypothetical protein SDRG_10172 [Saprolegnia diclina VS20]EQC32433.1 hypothetical protein SDRG_10172 [Saprolegnia diclina VS20]|eukprot:XP_008614374.1 hypothetical protein SDRG_10172 [Saprolegnia diclina VS20]
MGPSGPTPMETPMMTTTPVRKHMDPTSDDERVAALEAALRDKEHELLVLQRSHDEYVHSSCEIEHELELEVQRLEGARAKADEQLEKALDDARSAQQAVLTANKEVVQLQRVVEELTKTTSTLKTQVQVLEQHNDDLERRERELQASVEDLEARLDDSMEQYVFLQQERDDLRKQSDFRPPSKLAPVTVNMDLAKPAIPIAFHAIESPVPPTRRVSMPARVYISAKNSCGPVCAIM